VYEKISGIVKAHVLEYDPDTWGRMTTAQKSAVTRDLRQAVEAELPADGASIDVASLKHQWRRKLDQPALANSKHAQTGGKRRHPDAEYADAVNQQACGTLSQDHPMFSTIQALGKV